MNSPLKRISELSRTTKLWVDCLINPLFIMVMHVRAEPEADWPLHLKEMQRMFCLACNLYTLWSILPAFNGGVTTACSIVLHEC